jgi:hypothetical protein
MQRIARARATERAEGERAHLVCEDALVSRQW